MKTDRPVCPDAAHHHRTSPSVLTVASAAIGATAVLILAAGCIARHVSLLAVGLSLVVIATGLGCVVALRQMVDSAAGRALARAEATLDDRIDAAIASTAVQVAQTIAESLRESEKADGPGGPDGPDRPEPTRWLGDGDGPAVKPIPIYTR